MPINEWPSKFLGFIGKKESFYLLLGGRYQNRLVITNGFNSPSPALVTNKFEVIIEVNSVFEVVLTSKSHERKYSEAKKTKQKTQRNLNPRTYAQTYTPTVVQGGGGLMGPLPRVTDMLQFFETILSLVESL